MSFALLLGRKREEVQKVSWEVESKMFAIKRIAEIVVYNLFTTFNFWNIIKLSTNMAMDIKSFILKKLARREETKVSDIVEETGFSRAYINRFFQQLRAEGKIILIGKANQARYRLAEKNAVDNGRMSILSAHRILQNKTLSEDVALEDMKRETGIFLNLPKNISSILDYAFTEMLNNAIEHSKSKKIEVYLKRSESDINFKIIDWGVGIFRNIMQKKKLSNELEAIQDLIKGKQTTAPKVHTGEGIFFTSKAADVLIIHGSNKKLIFDNLLNDIFIKDARTIVGTRVFFTINLKSNRNLSSIFKAYSGNGFEFSKTKVVVKLFKIGVDYISRSQARRLISGLDKFKNIVLDFKGVDTIGQAFVDEIFRVWQRRYPNIKIEYLKANENVKFMIKHVLSGE